MQHLSKPRFFFHYDCFPSPSHLPVCHPYSITSCHPPVASFGIINYKSWACQVAKYSIYVYLPRHSLHSGQHETSCPHMRDAGLAFLLQSMKGQDAWTLDFGSMWVITLLRSPPSENWAKNAWFHRVLGPGRKQSSCALQTWGSALRTGAQHRDNGSARHR